MTNNDILKKLRVAHKLRDEDILAILKLVGFEITKSELNALYRNEEHPKYMRAGDQILRKFLDGLIIHLRGDLNAGKERKQVYQGGEKSSRYGSKNTDKPMLKVEKKGDARPIVSKGKPKLEITRKPRPRITRKDED